MKYIRVLILIMLSNTIWAQNLILSGTIEISISQGTIDGNMTLSNMPTLDDYEIMLNSGLNLEYIKNSERSYNFSYDKIYNSDISSESFLYSLKNKDGKFLPKELHFKYTGKFPVKKDTVDMRNYGDWKGNIAFNSQNLRMDGLQANWYPVIKDVDKDKTYEILKYDINVICNDCETLYVNGNDPVKSQSKNFKTDVPTEILLFAGNYEYHNIDDIFYLNPDIDYDEMKDFSGTVRKIKQFYEVNLKIPYEGNFNFIQTLPTSKDNAFLFVSYPSIVNIGRGGYGLKGFVSEKNSYAKPLIAHELAHYYFGSGYKRFNTEIGKVIQEGFSEYLSLLVTKELFGIKVYQSRVDKIFSRFEKRKEESFLPISKIKEYKDFDNYYAYVYNYFPAVLLAIEKEIGEAKMWIWMRNLLEENTDFTNYEFLLSTLKSAINNDEGLKLISDKYLNSDKVLENIMIRRN